MKKHEVAVKMAFVVFLKNVNFLNSLQNDNTNTISLKGKMLLKIYAISALLFDQ